ncbi:MAG: tRNA preQ1(34) S-adenosylmethionine ribosyltransferase-isomerase QueA [Moorea sp. SIO1F2]|uniref:tRNA preQ1(34) S-adenosylmethionine ribosyltransferase-isomerase QueA n=1 Tax=Moorena sp. SIO1F2 TaxID=2607819 RepID=UPI0013B8FEE5|nr:tRNA preQ1(34) S-adenosylmethionine ribosyltransferase-isomerase QueA [Moorena sp. SIO1F2]NET83815.1 tRNA preQ1(34) S-adenosylmethionine ribosyltransferase-isomerase QueA [Moorena sp. SIO1F2]
MTGIDKQTSTHQIDRLVSSYDYELPQEQIAQTPLSERDGSRLLVVDSPTHHSHHIFRELPQLLQPGDLLILNNTRVIPARLYGRKSTGVPVEILLLEERQHQGQHQGQQQGQHQSWLALVKPGRRLKPGAEIWFTPSSDLGLNDSTLSKHLTTPLPPLKATVLATDEATSGRILQFDFPEGVSWETLLELYGQVPLPPYIQDSQATPDQYQTIYAQKSGAVAAPTAGLHFTNELIENCRQQGIRLGYITLHVGVGTFRPVEVEDITEHDMHGEWLEVPQSTVEQIQETRATGGRVIAVGTTVVRALEGAVVDGELQPYCGKTNLFIYPGYQWQVVEGLITNFHLPRSSLLMLVSAMVGRERLLSLYQDAIALSYRFYSFGDAMLIFPEARDVPREQGIGSRE